MKSYKFKLKPSKRIENEFLEWLDVCRELYNSALQERRDAWKLNKISVNYYSQAAQLPEIKLVREDVAGVSAQVLQSTLRRLSKTFDDFFRRVKNGKKAGFPRFKGKSFFDSFTFPQMKGAFNLTGNNLRLSKIGKVKVRLHRQIIGKIKTCTIKREVKDWFVIFAVEDEKQPLPKTGKQIGADAGIENFLTLSNGSTIANFKFYESSQKKLRIVQRSIARRKKASNRQRKAVLHLRRIHQKIKNQRNNFGRRVSAWLVRNFDFIVIEDLNLIGMTKGFLAKQIYDVAWNSFLQKLTYKAENAGRQLVKINPNGTSQTCVCGETVKKDLSVRQHQCKVCGSSVHRDINSAQVILKLGLGNSLKDRTYHPSESVSLETVCFN